MRTPLLGLCLLLALASPLRAQEARSLAMGGCGTSLNWGPAALFWNPALLFYGAQSKDVILSLGSSALDTSNTGEPALDYSTSSAALSASNPVHHAQTYRGLVGFQWQAYAVGLIHEQEIHTITSIGALNFLSNRSTGTLTGSYDLGLDAKDERIENFCLGIGRSFPLGQATAALGSTFKVHQGTRYRRTLMTGLFPVGSANTVDFHRWSASSGDGYSYDFGVSLKPTGGIQMGYVIENMGSSFKWKAERVDVTLDGVTGAETATLPVSEEVDAPRPRAVRTGITVMSPSKDTILTAEMRRFQGDSHWRYGYEKIWIKQRLALRLGSFRDQVSGRRVWSGGFGATVLGIDLGLGLQADKFPVVQDSSLLGVAFAASAKL